MTNQCSHVLKFKNTISIHQQVYSSCLYPHHNITIPEFGIKHNHEHDLYSRKDCMGNLVLCPIDNQHFTCTNHLPLYYLATHTKQKIYPVKLHGYCNLSDTSKKIDSLVFDESMTELAPILTKNLLAQHKDCFLA